MTVNYVCIRNDQRWVSCQHCDDRYLVPSSQFFELSVSRKVQLNALRNNRNQPTYYALRSLRGGNCSIDSFLEHGFRANERSIRCSIRGKWPWWEIWIFEEINNYFRTLFLSERIVSFLQLLWLVEYLYGCRAGSQSKWMDWCVVHYLLSEH